MSTPGEPGAARPQRRNIILIGLRGAGKSAVGRALAARLGRPLVDTDEQIERAAGQTIRAIFEQEGEAGFRQRESRALAETLAADRQVVSAGGGAVLDPRNRELLRASGACVWLTAPADELHRRIAADPRSAAQRPALTALPGPDEVRHLLAQRGPLYAACAHATVETAGRTVAEVVAAVCTALATGGLMADP